MKSNSAPNAELGDFLALLQEVIPVCGCHLTNHTVCECTGMGSETYVRLKKGSFQILSTTMQ